MSKQSIFSKSIEWLGFGLALWGISLFWPGINQITTWPILIGFIISLNLLIIHLLASHWARKGHKGKGTGHHPPTHPTMVHGS